MPRTFSLARLMLGITLFCILCALAVNYREASFAYALLFASFVPTAIVCLTLVSFSRRRKTVLFCSIIGALMIGMCCLPVQLLPPPGDPTRIWTHTAPMFSAMTVFPPLGALLFGGAALLVDLLRG